MNQPQASMGVRARGMLVAAAALGAALCLAGGGGGGAGSCGIASALAGPLEPPPGPVSATGKTLAEIEPRTVINLANTPGDANSLFRISAPGSYVLAGNVTGVSGKSGIEIAASNVTIDLMGFDLRGVTGSLGGIVSSGSITSIEIRNGTVGSWGNGGVNIGGNGVFVCRNIRAIGNTGFGISFDTGHIEGCIAANNTGIGIRLNQGGTITRCLASANGGVGISGGIISVITECSSHSNTGVGISATGSSIVSRCTSQQNGGAGFLIDFASILTDSASRFNTGAGIEARNGSTVRGCTADRNSQEGILAASRSMIIGNSLSVNGQDTTTQSAGVRVTGSDNRIEGNNIALNDIGIRVEAAGNIILGNTCSGNTVNNYDIAADNVYGPIVDRRTPGSPVVVGHSAASTMGSTDPHANFSY